jgi:hypothetical protein
MAVAGVPVRVVVPMIVCVGVIVMMVIVRHSEITVA